MVNYFLGVDIGTGSTKAVAVNEAGKAIAEARYFYPAGPVQDPALILSAFLNCLNDITKQTGNQPFSVCLSSAMHSVIAVNENCTPLMPMLTWADNRSQQVADKLRGTELGKRIYRNCGTPIHAIAPLCKIIWLRENKNEIFKQTHKFISIKEYVWFHLFSEFAVDHSIASATALFDIAALSWNREAIDLAGIDIAQLSTPVANTYSCVKAGVTYVIGASDGCCANLGSFVTRPGIAALTIGTSGAIRITSPKPVIDEQSMIFNYLLGNQTYICGGATNNGGIVADWLLSNFLGNSSYEDLFARIATVMPGSDGLLFLPYLYGERAPLWNTEIKAGYFNINPRHTKNHFLRAGLEGMCFALNDILQTVERSSTIIEKLHISGGFINSAIWTQILADVTGKQLIIAQKDDASAIGAVFLAMHALGMPVPQQTGFNTIYPNTDHHLAYQSSFLLFKKFQKTMLSGNK